MSNTIGVLGVGNMGSALLRGLMSTKDATTSFCAYTRSPQKLIPFESEGVQRLDSCQAVAKEADLILLAVKPAQVEGVLEEIAPYLSAQKILLSIAAGIPLSVLQAKTAHKAICIRCMPDTPALVGKGIFAFAFEETCPKAIEEAVLALFKPIGLCLALPEAKFAAFSALIGAGPAYLFMVFQALVQAAVTMGFGHEEARSMVLALGEGSAVLAKHSKEHLMALRDAVCSPKGLTIAGVNVLERKGLTGLLMDAVFEAEKRAIRMEEESLKGK